MIQTMGNLWSYLTGDDDCDEVWELEDYMKAWALGPMTGALWLGPGFDLLASVVGGVEPRLSKAPTSAMAEFAVQTVNLVTDDDIDIQDVGRTLERMSRGLGGDAAALGVSWNILKQLLGLTERITDGD